MKSWHLPAVLALCLGLAAGPAGAALYGYEDESGTIHITSRPPKNQKHRLLTPSEKRSKGFKDAVGSQNQYKPVASNQARVNGLPLPLLLAIIKTESNFNHRAVSPKGAEGLMQIMPGTQDELGLRDPYDAEDNIKAGAAYFRKMLARFQDVDLALAAYNAGPRAVEKYGGVPPYEETRRYIQKVHWYYDYYKKKIDPDHLPEGAGRFAAGYQSLGRGDLPRAARHFEQAVAQNPDSPEAHYNLGLVYQRLGRLDAGVRHYRRALELDPYLTEAYYNMAIVFEQLNQRQAAIEAWKRFIQYEVDESERREARDYIGELEQMAD
jgi:tetratricopeptide (TPR) repeat protein